MMMIVPTKHFDKETFEAAMRFYGLPAGYQRFFCSRLTGKTKANGDPETTLGHCDPVFASERGRAVWVQINPPRDDLPLTKASNNAIAKLQNIQLDFEYPADPHLCHNLALELAELIVGHELAEQGLPVEDSGAGCHIVIPITPLDVEELGGGELVNEAVRRVVTDYIKKGFNRLAEQYGLAGNDKFKLEAFDISRILSAPGTFRPGGVKAGEADYLLDGYVRRWLAPYNTPDNYPVRHESAELAKLIVVYIEQIKEEREAENKRRAENRQSLKVVSGAGKDNAANWIRDYVARTPLSGPSNSEKFYSLICAAWLYFGDETVITDNAELIDELSGGKYGKTKAKHEAERALKKAALMPREEPVEKRLIFNGKRWDEAKQNNATQAGPKLVLLKTNNTDTVETETEIEGETQNYAAIQNEVEAKTTNKLEPELVAELGTDGPVDPLTLLGFTPDDDGNAQAFCYLYGKQFLYTAAYGWLAWAGTHWEAGGADAKLYDCVVKTLTLRREVAIEAKIAVVVKVSIGNMSRINACSQALTNILYTSNDVFDNKPDFLNCKNGAINLKTGKLYPHNQNQLFTYCLPVEYNPHADQTAWIDFLNNVVVEGSQEIIDYLKLSVGYTLTGHTREECLFYVCGPTRSGKGTFTETLLTLMGRPLSTETDFNTFTAKRDASDSNFDMAPLRPARAVFASESNRWQRLNPAKIKQLTGGNEINCCFKHKDFFTYRPQYKVWLSSNWDVNGDVDDDALWGRIRIIKFPNSFLNQEDKSLKLRMKSLENLAGVLAWAVEGAVRWYSLKDGLQTPQLVKDEVKTQRSNADQVQEWLDQVATVDAYAWTSNGDVMHSYKKWAEENNYAPREARSLTTTLKAKGFVIGVQKKVNGSNSKGIQGLSL